jgi:hypothetical protein
MTFPGPNHADSLDQSRGSVTKTGKSLKKKLDLNSNLKSQKSDRKR